MTYQQQLGVIKCWNQWRREYPEEFEISAHVIGAGKTLSMFEKIARPIVHRVREAGPINWLEVYEEIIESVNYAAELCFIETIKRLCKDDSELEARYFEADKEIFR